MMLTARRAYRGVEAYVVVWCVPAAAAVPLLHATVNTHAHTHLQHTRSAVAAVCFRAAAIGISGCVAQRMAENGCGVGCVRVAAGVPLLHAEMRRYSRGTTVVVMAPCYCCCCYCCCYYSASSAR
ncbi:unnamed protein product [Closterium sp. NIES-54]